MCRLIDLTWLGLLLGAAALAGCGDDAVDGAPDAGAGARRAHDRGGAGGSDAGGGQAAADGGGGRMDDEPIHACGSARMSGPCPKPEEDVLGCPVLDLSGLLQLPSCCTPQGMCGVVVYTVGGQDCVDLASAAQRARMAGATAVFPEPRACDADAGVADAGG